MAARWCWMEYFTLGREALWQGSLPGKHAGSGQGRASSEQGRAASGQGRAGQLR